MAQLSIKDVKNKLKSYRYGDQTARDIHALLTNFNSLKVQDAKPFVHPTGATENMVSVSGTIPVKIRGHHYNIPIAIWLKQNHPYHCPIVFVTPTHEMGIQQSQFVDNSGRVFLPYLTEWKQGSSDLTALTQVMCAMFVDYCPVYSRRRPTNPPPQQPVWPRPQPPLPPSPYQSATPPYPQQPQPPYPTSQYSTPYPTGHPQMPMPYGVPPRSYPPPATTGAQPPYPPGPPGPYPGMYPPTSQPTSSYQPSPSSSLHSPPTTSSILTGAAAGLGIAAASISEEEERQHFEESERIKRQSLESAVEDKIRRQVKQVLDSAETEMESLLVTQEELKKGSQRINQMLQEMENKQSEVNQSVDMLISKNAELKHVLDYLRAQPEKVNADEAVAATSPLFNQILRLYAEENAIDDTIYYLGEALRKGVIEPDVFLKHVRELSREQFMARATIMKARVTAGLPSHGTTAA